jgi:hypothetical protein
MKLAAKILRIILIVLTFFLALSAFGGGIGLLAKLNSPPVDYLQGSPFKDFTLPGLSLFVLVGGSALLDAILLLRKSKFALLSAATAGTIIMFFEFIEGLVIGSDPGVARALQVIYFETGTAIMVASMGAWFIDLLSLKPVQGV